MPKVPSSSIDQLSQTIAVDASSDMINADITIVQFSNGVATIHDYFAQTFAQPQLDTSLGGTDDVQLISGSHVNGIATVEFRKKVAATDAFDHSIRKTGETPVIFAWHDTSTDLIYHTYDKHGLKRSIGNSGQPIAAIRQSISMQRWIQTRQRRPFHRHKQAAVDRLRSIRTKI